jgi:lambda family phage portal protein
MSIPTKRAEFFGNFSSSAFAAGSLNSPEMAAYRPAMRSPDAALLINREVMDARTRDMERNSGIVQGGINRKLDGTVGASLRPQVKPNWRLLGISQEQAREFGREVEAVWDAYSNDPARFADAGRRLSIAAMARVEYWHWVSDGRAATVPLWLPRSGSSYATSFMAIDPMRISNPNGQPDGRFMRGGIELDKYGAAVAYWVKEQNPGDLLFGGEATFLWNRIPAYTHWGRRRMIYGFSQRQAEQSQGRSPLLAALKKIRMLEKRDDLELQSAANQATFGFYMQSELPSDVLFQMMSEAPTGGESTAAANAADYMAFQAGYYAQNNYTIGGAVVPHLLPNEKIGTVQSETANGDFTDSQRYWMTLFGWSLDLTYEQISGDFSKSAYVGIKAGFEVARQSMIADRKIFSDTMMTPKLDLWLEEAIDAGVIKLPKGAPAYTAARAAYIASTEWIGPGAISIDPAKESSARQTNMMIGYRTLEQELSEDGIDSEDQIKQLGEEEGWREAAGIPSLWAAPLVEADASVPTAPDAPDYEAKPQP